MRRSALSLITSTVVALCIIATAQTAVGDTIVLKDGTIVEGEILRESTRFVKIKTRFGDKSYKRNKIEKIIKENREGSAVFSINNVREYTELTDLAKALKNAYTLSLHDALPIS